jgi:hypothetical protein
MSKVSELDPSISVHSFGVGIIINGKWLKEIACEGRGSYTNFTNTEDDPLSLQNSVTMALNCAIYQSLKNCALEWRDGDRPTSLNLANPKVIQTGLDRLPDVFQRDESIDEIYNNQLIHSYRIIDIEQIESLSFTFKCYGNANSSETFERKFSHDMFNIVPEKTGLFGLAINDFL